MTRYVTRALSLSLRRASMIAACLCAGLCLALSACGDDESPTDGGDDGTFNGTIRVLDNAFSPKNVTISVGDSVTWSWQGSSSHTVTNGTDPATGGNLFDHGPKSSGTFGYRFTSAGTVPYFCRPHFSMGMTGSITVQP